MPTLQFITGSGSGSTVATGVVGQIAALNQSIANLNNVYFQYYSTGATTNNSVSFYLNGNLVTISNVDPTLTLVDYLRYQTPYKGVKQHCRQGGCGVCAVMVSYYDSDSATFRNVSLNSCLKLVVQCDGLAIWTTEGIKISSDKYHPVQERIAKTYGLQCGACTTAQVMSQYTALQTGTFMQRAEYTFLEKNFDGNLCRCSCYPGIIKMARSFLPTGPGCPQVWSGPTLLGWDLNATGPAGANTNPDDGFYSNLGAYATGAGTYAFNQLNPKGFILYNPALDKHATSNSTIQTYLQNYTPVAGTYTNTLKGVTYAKVTSLASLISQIQIAGVTNCKIVAGSTSYGVPGFARPTTNLFLDINGISELHSTRVTSTGAVFGSIVPINKAVSLMYTGASNDTKFNDIADHLFYISGNHVRNVASLVGGLVMAKKGGFASDVAPLMIAAGATLNCTYIYPGYTVDVTGLSIEDYFNVTETDKHLLIKSIVIPAKATGEIFWSYRVAQRYFNSRAWLNCAASYTVTANVISNTRIAYGGLIGGFGVKRAPLTEAYLNGKDISSAAAGSTGALNTIISGAITQIGTDIDSSVSQIVEFVDTLGGDGKVAFRKNLARTLWYLSFLNILKFQGYLTNYSTIQDSLETWISGAADSQRVPNLQFSDMTDFTQKSDYPAHFSWPRLDAIQIAAGEVRYNDDMQHQPGELWGASALSKIAVGSVDWNSPVTQSSLAAARATPGVAHVVTVSDLVAFTRYNNIMNIINEPGSITAITNFTGANFNAGASSQEVFGNQFINYYGQRIAIVLSEDAELAQKVADNMVFAYTGVYSNYAVNVFDGVNKGYVLGTGTTTNGINAVAYNRKATEVWYNWPYTGGNSSYDLNPSVISYNQTTYQNLLPKSDSPTGFVRPDGTMYTGAYYTGANGELLPWSDYILESTGAYTSEKYHLALERSTINCYLDEMNCWNIYGNYQFLHSSRNVIAALGIPHYQIRLKGRRIGGAFGGKLGYIMDQLSVAVVVCSWVAGGKMIRLVPTLQEDSQSNGAEGEMWCPYKLSFDATGTLNNAWITPYTDTNYGSNPSWKSLSTTAYPSTAADSFTSMMDAIKTLVSYFQNNLGLYITPNATSVPRPPRCAYRGPYASILNYVYGDMMDNISAVLDRSFTDIAYLNAPQASWDPNSTIIPINQDRYEWRIMMDRFLTQPKYDYVNRLAAVNAFNAANKYVKRSIQIFFGKYDVSVFTFTGNNSDTVIKILPTGEVLVYLSYAESGQGGTIKAAQLISSKLKVPMSLIKFVEVDRNLIQGDTGNAGSRGTNSMLRAVDYACDQALVRFAPNLTGAANGDVWAHRLFNATGGINTTPVNLSAAMTGNNGVGNVTPWKSLITSQSRSFYYFSTGTNTKGVFFPTNTNPTSSTTINTLIFQGNLNYYSADNGTGPVYNIQNVAIKTPTYVASMSEVEVNMLTGNVNPIRVDIIGDVANTPNPSIDIGQMYGGYIFALGAAFKEERTWDSNMKSLITDTWDYKVPCVVDIPEVFNVDYYGYNPTGTFTTAGGRFVMDGKGITEAACSAVNSTFFAAKSAVREFRKQELGNTVSARKFNLIMPATPDRIQAAAGFTSSILNVNPV
jgi:xanthine dehydrogenase iron-sulfur cluster and FAD-binding subunit A/xanthine dehydrogenase molybdopterin-binding subunit B